MAKTIEDIIVNAGRQHKTISFNYSQKQQGNQKEKVSEIEPYGFRSKGGTTYFYGYDVVNSKITSFELEAMSEVKATMNGFRPRWQVEF